MNTKPQSDRKLAQHAARIALCTKEWEITRQSANIVSAEPRKHVLIIRRHKRRSDCVSRRRHKASGIRVGVESFEKLVYIVLSSLLSRLSFL